MKNVVQDVETELSLEEQHHSFFDTLSAHISTATPRIWTTPYQAFVRFSFPFHDIVSPFAEEDFSEHEGEFSSIHSISPSLVEWLFTFRHQEIEKTYWRNREQTLEVAGIGTAYSVQGDSASLATMLRCIHDCTKSAPASVRFYGGTRFDSASKPDSLWSSFGDTRFTLPFLECVRTLHGSSHQGLPETMLHCTIAHHLLLTPEEAVELVLQKIEELRKVTIEALHNQHLPHIQAHTHNSNSYFAQEHSHPAITQRTETPNYSTWEGSIDAALEQFASDECEKIVLARRVSIVCKDAPNLQRIFLQRLQKSERSTAFLFENENSTAFFGVTPELLYHREGRVITTEAVAGTRKRGKTSQDDEEIADELLSSDKDRREHASVQRFIASALDELTESFSIGTVEVLKLSHLQHLYAQFSGRLRAGIDDTAIVEQLHPTPAVGGTPRTKALEFLREHEGFDRGWYAAPVGWINAHAAEFVVAIRSALLQGNTLHLFSGAGIVSGSEAEKEWKEIEMKITPYLEMFQHEN
jgi:menaquinone-specific isochorismate synthase